MFMFDHLFSNESIIIIVPLSMIEFNVKDYHKSASVT